MSDVLARILELEREDLSRRRRQHSLAELEARARTHIPRGFRRALAAAADAGKLALIAEIKRASPSRGLIRADFDPARLARAYAAGGASCLSVLTNTPFFQGEDGHLTAARRAVSLPILRKSFLIDPWQVVEARAIGADAVLVIMAAVDDGCARDLLAAAREWGLDVLVEVHDEAELERALTLDQVDLLGINNRNLRTLEVSLATFERLAPRVPPGVLLVAESGLYAHEDLLRMRRAGARAFLVGESLMRQEDVTAATRRLLGAEEA